MEKTEVQKKKLKEKRALWQRCSRDTCGINVNTAARLHHHHRQQEASIFGRQLRGDCAVMLLVGVWHCVVSGNVEKQYMYWYCVEVMVAGVVCGGWWCKGMNSMDGVTWRNKKYISRCLLMLSQSCGGCWVVHLTLEKCRQFCLPGIYIQAGHVYNHTSLNSPVLVHCLTLGRESKLKEPCSFTSP